MRHAILSFLALGLFAAGALAQEINVLSWNVESGGGVSDPEVIAEQIEAFAGYDLLGFSEVDPADAENYASACLVGEGANFSFLSGTTGGSDSMLLVWNSDRFEFLEAAELMELRAQTGRAPLAVKLRDTETDTELWFMVNHLHRSNANKRNEQAAGLRLWFQAQTIPVIAVGDYNMDVDVESLEGNAAFNIIREGNHVRWVEPAEKMKTQSSPSFNSILDFVFINDDAASWAASSTILVLPGEFEPANEKSDHRPIDATFQIPTTPPPSPTPVFGLTNANPRAEVRRLAARAAGARRELDSGMRATPAATPSADARPRRRDELILEQIRLMRSQLDLLEEMLTEDGGGQ